MTLLKNSHPNGALPVSIPTAASVSQTAQATTPDIPQATQHAATLPPEDKLTAEEEGVCRRFHWDPEGCLQRKKEMAVYHSVRGTYLHFPVPMRTRSSSAAGQRPPIPKVSESRDPGLDENQRLREKLQSLGVDFWTDAWGRVVPNPRGRGRWNELAVRIMLAPVWARLCRHSTPGIDPLWPIETPPDRAELAEDIVAQPLTEDYFYLEHTSDPQGVQTRHDAKPIRQEPAEGQPVEISNAFYREGEVWLIRYEGQSYHFKPAVGFLYIWTLLRHPGCELAAKQVLALSNAGAIRSVSEEEIRADGHSEGSSLQELADPPAIAEYKAQARDVEQELQIAKRDRQETEIARLTGILVQINEHIEKTRGLFGKTRSFSDDDDRARSAVTMAINRASDAMAERSRALADYFEAMIDTGKKCIFRDVQTAWRLAPPTTKQ